jgi:hypothetical protein
MYASQVHSPGDGRGNVPIGGRSAHYSTIHDQHRYKGYLWPHESRLRHWPQPDAILSVWQYQTKECCTGAVLLLVACIVQYHLVADIHFDHRLALLSPGSRSAQAAPQPWQHRFRAKVLEVVKALPRSGRFQFALGSTRVHVCSNSPGQVWPDSRQPWWRAPWSTLPSLKN